MNLDQICKSVVALRATIPDDAFTATTLGTSREGSGVVIRADGLILTIGYLIMEAEEVWLTRQDGRVFAGHPLAHDQDTGFGLVQPLGELGLPPLPFADSTTAKPRDKVILADGEGQLVSATITALEEFAGYWEYLLDQAIFTSPAHPAWGGAALLDSRGHLLGIGSLRLQTNSRGKDTDSNMVVPIDLLPPILDDLLTFGRARKPPRPWLGALASEADGKVVIMSVAPDGPAARAGLRQGDIIADVADGEVANLADFYRKFWAAGPAGSEIPLRVIRQNRDTWLRPKSADRTSFLRKPQLQ